MRSTKGVVLPDGTGRTKRQLRKEPEFCKCLFPPVVCCNTVPCAVCSPRPSGSQFVFQCFHFRWLNSPCVGCSLRPKKCITSVLLGSKGPGKLVGHKIVSLLQGRTCSLVKHAKLNPRWRSSAFYCIY